MFNLIQCNLIENRQEESCTWLSFPLPPVSPVCKLSHWHSICRHLPSAPVEVTPVLLFLPAALPHLPPHCLFLLRPPKLRWVPSLPALASLVAQMVKNLPAMQETQVRSLGREDPLEKRMTTHSSILAWRIPWIEELGRLWSMGSQRVRHSWVNNTFTL